MTRKYLLSGLLITILLVTIIVANRSRAEPLFSPEDLTPTAIPPEDLTPTAIPPERLTQMAHDSANQSLTATAYPPFATQFAQEFTQTEQAFQLTSAAAPTSDMQQQYPIFSNAPLSPEEILSGNSNYPLAGYGILYEDRGSSDADLKYTFNGLVWQQSTHDAVIWVTGGRAFDSPSQGAVRVIIAPHYPDSVQQNDVIIESPVASGELTITDAVGERLILTSEEGQTFYFDVPALRFVDSLEEIVPTVTPLPTIAYEPPLVPTDDALDEPSYLDSFQLEDTDINYYINSPTDYDWFAFVSQAEGRLTVSLNPRGNNYGFRVILVDFDGIGTIIGEDISSGREAKQVAVDHAPPGNYIVRVWSLDGSYEESQPYTLRFEPPKPEKITPILECVTENPDGTFAAHFGYENPNTYVVVIDSRHQNTFHPAPTFRTGEPEYFAPGRVEDFFAVLFDGNDLTWTLEGSAVTANRNSPRCP